MSGKVTIRFLVRKLMEETHARWYFHLTKGLYKQEEDIFYESLKIKGRAIEKWRFQRIAAAWDDGNHVHHHSHTESAHRNDRYVGNDLATTWET